MPDNPQPPLTELAAQAALHHEMYSAYVEAGFTEEQAMQLLATVIMTVIGSGS